MARLLPSPALRARGGFTESRGSFWLSFFVLTLISAATGALLATQLVQFTRDQIARETQTLPASQGPVPLYVENARLRQLEPLVTNLAAPRDAWVRVQASVILSDQPVDDIGILTGHIEEDILAYLRTVTISHLEGPVGLQHLREDLNERAIARSRGAVREVILESLVIQ